MSQPAPSLRRSRMVSCTIPRPLLTPTGAIIPLTQGEVCPDAKAQLRWPLSQLRAALLAVPLFESWAPDLCPASSRSFPSFACRRSTTRLDQHHLVLGADPLVGLRTIGMRHNAMYRPGKDNPENLARLEEAIKAYTKGSPSLCVG